MVYGYGRTALLYAVKNNKEDIVKLLIPFEADLVDKDSIDMLVEIYNKACIKDYFFRDKATALIALLSTSKQGNVTSLSKEERLEMIGRMVTS